MKLPACYYLPILALFYIAMPSFAYAADAANSVNPAFIGRCDLISKVVGIDHLAKFERVPGSYYVPALSHWKDLKKDGWPGVVIPINEHSKRTALDAPFQGDRFTDPRDHVTVSVFTMTENSSRVGLSTVLRQDILSNYKNRPLFSFLEESLGVYIDDFCGSASTDRSVAMFMSTSVLPLPGGKTKVYRLTLPQGLLLVSADPEGGDIKLIFPGKSDDSLNYAMVSAPAEYIHKIIKSLQKIQKLGN